MNLTGPSLKNPAALGVVVVVVCLFGLLAIQNRPIQLLPDLERPQISVITNWRQAAPAEVESQIIEPQEDVLRRTPGVLEMSATIARGFGNITMTFSPNADMDQALINVINNLNQAPPLPVDANEPFVAAGGGGGGGNYAASIQVYPQPDNPNQDLASPEYQRLFSDVVQPRLAAIEGVSRVDMNGFRPEEIRVTFDPWRAAALGVGIGEITAALSGSTDSSGGFADVGRRQYTVRVIGQEAVDRLGELIVAWRGDRPIHLREIATIRQQLVDPFGVNIRSGYPAFYIGVAPSNDANTVTILDGVNAALAELNEGDVGAAGLIAELSFDASIYIRRAIALVQNNLGLGVLLAIGVLWFFLRTFRATLIIAASIPISVSAAFIALQVFGISLNVISLAGLAFSVGLVMDAAIIVQENIVRYRQRGVPDEEAIQRGTLQVRGALFASTMTTVVIFLPILFMQGLEGQMFADLALTLSVSVLASLLTAMTVVPVLSRFWLGAFPETDRFAHWWGAMTRLVMRLTATPVRRGVWIAGLLAASVTLIVALKPNADFLPSAQADAITVFFNMPPGVNNDVFEDEIGADIIERLRPYMERELEPYVRGYNLSMFGTFNILYFYPLNPEDTERWLEIFRGDLLRGIPDTQAFASRASLLGIGFDGGRTISLDLQGADMGGLMEAARAGMGIIRELIPGAVVRPVPGLSLAEPELQILPDRRRLIETGVTTRELATAVRAMTGGLFAGEYFDGNERYDMILRTGAWENPDELAAMPIHTPLAGPQTIGSLATLERTVGPTQLTRFGGQRTISLQVLPPEQMTVEEALGILRDDAGPRIYAVLPEGGSINYRGSADQLEEALVGMRNNFLLAIFILFLVMAAIFRSVQDALLVLLVMPLAMAGGILALWLINLVSYQSLDMLTMIGFIILLGLVVNNAILLVSQTRDGEADGLSRVDAVAAAVRVRARPVYMSTLTSIFGMLPLMLVPGVGSDVYRGLATVIVGGMAVSAVFTLVLMPALLQVTWPEPVRRLLGRPAATVSPAPAALGSGGSP
ncbi:MAG: efflux RND transporter permease subunit [Pseudomonadota bacterium]